jgi:hypothetical protein
MVLHAHDAPAPGGLDHLRLAQTGLWALRLAAPEVPSGAIVRHECGELIPQPVRQQQRGAVWSQHLGDLMHETWCHSEATLPDVDGHDELVDRVQHPSRPGR